MINKFIKTMEEVNNKISLKSMRIDYFYLFLHLIVFAVDYSAVKEYRI